MKVDKKWRFDGVKVISEENLELLKESSAFKSSALGNGKVIGFTDNTNFRAFWYGTNKLLMNALFFRNVF